MIYDETDSLEPKPKRTPALSIQLSQTRERLAEVQMTLDDRDQEIATLKAQLELAERIATQEHGEMISQDSVHAEELAKIATKLNDIHADVLALHRKTL